mgnify:CR=1 FL=1|tara:strand:- start:30168 stop:30377 length:210 start_codon:yes stop_codon:yes gene_type:complete
MPRKSNQPLQRVTLNLFEGDFTSMTDLYPDMTAGVAIRQLVRDHIKKVQERSNAIARDTPTEVNLNGIT